MVADATLALSEIVLRTVGVGHDSSMVVTREALLKMTAVGSRPKPRSPTNLSVGLDLVPLRLDRL